MRICNKELSYPPPPKHRTVHLDIIKVFTPTDAQVWKRLIKIYIKRAPTYFGVIAIIRDRNI
jgi:hypothetical protein